MNFAKFFSYGNSLMLTSIVLVLTQKLGEAQLSITHKFNNTDIGVRAGGARGAAAPPKFGQLRFFGQQEKIWAKPVFKDVSMFIIIIIIILKR